MKKVLLATVAATLLLAAGAAVATPKTTVSPAKHPNIAEAQRLIGMAWDKVSAAQAANKGKLAGHAGKAKALLEEASAELKLAAEAADGKR